MRAVALAWTLVVALTLVARDGAAQCAPIVVGNPDGNYIVPGVQGDIVYSRINGQTLAMDAYVQRAGARRPAVVVVHGGSWDTGSRSAFTGQFLELLTRAGFNWFAIDYRLGGLSRFADAVDDLRAAVEFVRCHARDFKIDPENVALLGEDAGAHLALMLATDGPPGVTGVVTVGGLFDLSDVAALKARTSSELLRVASPLNRSLTKMPPVLVVHGGSDTEAPPRQAEAFCAALRSAGRVCTLTIVDGASHRPENWWPSQWSYKTKLAAWLADTMHLTAANHQPYTTSLVKDVVFDSLHGLAIDAWAPKGRGPFPAVIIAHGGGWEAGDKVTYITPLFEPLAKAGFAWFSIDYRLTPQFRNPDQLDDFRNAIKFIRANAGRFRIDPNRIAIVGESASGQLVAQLATEHVPGVAAYVSFYGVYDFLQMTPQTGARSIAVRLFGYRDVSGELSNAAQEQLSRFSPIFHVKQSMPPMLLIQGTADRLHAQAVEFSERLKSVGATFERYDVAGAPHGVENWEGHPEWMGYKRVLAEWLNAALKQH